MNKKYFYMTIAIHTILYLLAVVYPLAFRNIAENLITSSIYFILALYPLILVLAVVGRVVGWRLNKKYPDDKYIKRANVINVVAGALIVPLFILIFVSQGTTSG